jgi:hypothetical protein
MRRIFQERKKQIFYFCCFLSLITTLKTLIQNDYSPTVQNGLSKFKKKQDFKLIERSSLSDEEAEFKQDLEYLENVFQTAKKLKSLTKHKYKTIKHQTSEINPNKDIYILEYTKVFFNQRFCDTSSFNIFNSYHESCPYTNCIYTCDKETYTKKADALIFHMVDLDVEFQRFKKFEIWLKETKQFPFKSAEEKMRSIENPAQVWILWHDEAYTLPKEHNKLNNMFNWTMSYSFESEMYEGAYGLIAKRPNLLVKDLIDGKTKALGNEFKKRKNAILWFVSNCKSLKRIEIALNISKYYPVHIYGHCDPFSKSDYQANRILYKYLTIFNRPVDECPYRSECENEKLASYKYYFAFENRNCTDYITEKFWRSLNKNIIPIVLHPSSDSYKRAFVPMKSLIHLENFEFKSELLANYLHKIDDDFSLYFSHLKWTYVYLQAYYKAQDLDPHRMCSLCKQLNQLRSKSSISYTKIADFFNEKCFD